MNVINICKLLYKKTLERSSVHSISAAEEETSVAINLLDILEDLSNSDSFTIESEDSLEVSDVDHLDPNYLVEIEDDEEQLVVGNHQFSLKYMRRIVDFARPGVAFTSNARLCDSLDPRLILAQLSSLSSFLLYS